MPVTADDAVAALLITLSRLADAHPAGWVRSERGVAALYTGAPVPMFNGVITERADADADIAAEMLDEIAATGVPYHVAVRSEDHADFVELARSHGLTSKETVPLMVLESPARVVGQTLSEGLTIRELTPEESDQHVELAAASFDMPVEVARQLMAPEVFAIDGVRSYLGEIDGRPVATVLGMTTGDVVGVFNVGTLEDARGRGFGAALTVRAIADGVAKGAQWSYLQSSAMGFPVYRRLGFETVEEWSQYLPAAPGAS